MALEHRSHCTYHERLSITAPLPTSHDEDVGAGIWEVDCTKAVTKVVVRKDSSVFLFMWCASVYLNFFFLYIFMSRDESKLNGTMWELVRKYIRCSSRTTIGHIKKYLKLKLKLSAVDQVKVTTAAIE